MSIFPSYDFNDPVLDYTEVESTVKSMQSYLNEQRYSKKLTSYAKTILTEVNPVLTAMRYDSSVELDNEERWRKDVKASYLFLYPLT